MNDLDDIFGPVPTVTKKEEDIEALIKAGFVLFPLSRNSKVPKKGFAWREVKIGQFSSDQLLRHNYGIALTPSQMVIDFDPRNVVEGDEPLGRLSAAVGGLPNTYKRKTGGGGIHFHYSIPEGVLIAGKLAAYPGIDFKSHGGYVLGEGSVHPTTGKEYEILEGSPDAVAPAPQALLDLLRKEEVVFTGAGVHDGWHDDDDTKDRYAEYLRKAAPPSISGQGGDANAFKVACQGRDLALSPEVCWTLMVEHWNPRCLPPWGDDELRSKVIHAYRYGKGAPGSAQPAAVFADVPTPKIDPAPAAVDLPEGVTPKVTTKAVVVGGGIQWELTPQGQRKKSFANLTYFFKSPDHGLHKVVGFNEFTGREEFTNPAPWHGGKMPFYPALSDKDLKMFKDYLARVHGFEMQIGTIEEAIVITAHENKFHPVRDYLNGLEWDRKPRLNTWLTDHLGAEDSKYTRAVARKTLVAAVARVFDPGCKFDSVLILEGDQGIGKSGVIRILGGNNFVGDFPLDPHSRDTIGLMQGKWLLEIAELELAGKPETDALKAFITRPSDVARLAYDRKNSEFPRQSIFIASKNPSADRCYLKDDTGNRRWQPVWCDPKGGKVNFVKLIAARDQLWAEAVYYYKVKKEPLYMETPELEEMAREVVALRHAEHSWTERIGSWVSTLDAKRDFLTPRDVFIDAMGGIDKQLDRRSQLSIAICMRTLGWKPAERIVEGRPIPVRGYERDPRRAQVPPIPTVDNITALL